MNDRSGQRMLFSCILFTVGATSRFDITIIARIPVSEFIAFGLIPFFLPKVVGFRHNPRFRMVLLVLLLWGFGVILSDVLNGFEFSRFMRGFAKPVFCFLWMLFFIGVASTNYRSLIWLPTGAVVAAFQNYYFPQEYTLELIGNNEYQITAFSLLPVILSSGTALATWIYRKSKIASGSVFVTCSVILAMLASPRSATALMFLNGVIIFFMWHSHRRRQRGLRWSKRRIWIFSLLLLSSSYILYEVYIFTAREGYLGELQRQKLVEQERTIFGDSILGLLLAGRTPVYAAILAIMDRPILGYGSWSGHINADYYIEAVSAVGTDPELFNRISRSGISAQPGHSVLFGIWMENGIFSAIAVFLIAFMIIREFYNIIQVDSSLAPWLISLTTTFIWGFLFSPFSVQARMVIGLFLALYVLGINEHKYRTRRIHSSSKLPT